MHPSLSPSPRRPALLLAALLAAAGLLVVTRLRPPPPTPTPGPTPPAPAAAAKPVPAGAVVAAAAGFATVARPWQVRAEPTAAGDHRCLEIPDGAGKPPQVNGVTATELVVPAAGTYHPWLRCWWQDACGNSLVVRLADGPPTTVGQDSLYWQWHWLPAGEPRALAAGPVRFELHNREDGVRVDQVLLCPDPSFVPDGAVGGPTAEPVHPQFTDDFLRSPGTPSPGWTWDPAHVQLDAGLDPNGVDQQGSLIVDAPGPTTALAGEPVWRDYRVEATVRVERPGRFALLSHASGNRFLALRWSPGATAGEGELALVRQMGDRTSVLTRQPLALTPHQWYRFALRVAAVGVQASVDGLERLTHPLPPSTGPGHAGLAVDNARVRFDDFTVTPAAEPLPARPLELHAFTTPQVVRTVFDDFTEEEVRRMHTGPDADAQRREEQYYVMVGNDPNESRFTPTGGRWAVRDGGLRARAEGADSRLLRNRPFTGDLEVAFRLHLTEPGSLGGVALEAAAAPQGHVLLLGRDGVRWRPETGPETTCPLPAVPAEPWWDVRLQRRARDVTVEVNGVPVAAFHEVPLGAGLQLGLAAAGDAVEFDDLQISALPEGTRRFYPFDRPEPDWVATSESWGTHTGITCKDASQWVTCRPGPQGTALWRKFTAGGDTVALSAHVFEHSVWYGWQREPTHEHFPYTGFGLLIASDGSGATSGYAVVVNPANRGRTVLARNGRVVAEAPQDRVPLTFVGGHAPVRPRGSNVCLRRDGARARLVLNGVTVIDWQDPAPLAGDHVAIFATAGILNWADLAVNAGAPPQPARFWPGPPPDFDRAALRDLLDSQAR